MVDKTCDLRLGELRICADALSLYAHLLVDERGEQVNRDSLEHGVVLDELGQVVTVHLRHLDIADNAGDVRENITAHSLVTADVVPSVSAVVEVNDVLIACFLESLDDESVKEGRVLRDNDVLVALILARSNNARCP